ncbi:unnamed protein product [Lactuca virosa]|uniref:Uncharacterized protein n=1 Tax=Lactuca virosa TaxID=75947 RepID=A0AAU9PAE8_9ASTR|nr:unnamed protein product [Lactuca virosa]
MDPAMMKHLARIKKKSTTCDVETSNEASKPKAITLKDQDPIGTYYKEDIKIWEKKLEELKAMGPVFSGIHDYDPHKIYMDYDEIKEISRLRWLKHEADYQAAINVPSKINWKAQKRSKELAEIQDITNSTTIFLSENRKSISSHPFNLHGQSETSATHIVKLLMLSTSMTKSIHDFTLITGKGDDGVRGVDGAHGLPVIRPTVRDLVRNRGIHVWHPVTNGVMNTGRLCFQFNGTEGDFTFID